MFLMSGDLTGLCLYMLAHRARGLVWYSELMLSGQMASSEQYWDWTSISATKPPNVITYVTKLVKANLHIQLLAMLE